MAGDAVMAGQNVHSVVPTSMNSLVFVGDLLPSAAMKPFGILLAGAAALPGVTATTCPAEDRFSEAIKEDLVLSLIHI